MRRRSPTATRSSTTSATRRARTTSTATSASGIGSSAPHGPRPRRAGTVDDRARRIAATGAADVQFFLPCAGYYRYDAGYMPELPGAERFEGPIVHPQKWPEDLDYEGKRVRHHRQRRDRRDAGPGDGGEGGARDDAAALADLHRVAARARRDRQLAAERTSGAERGYELSRWKNVLLQIVHLPVRPALPALHEEDPPLPSSRCREELGRDTTSDHFSPRYNPWDQRLCLVPDGDLFRSISGPASVVTDRIDDVHRDGHPARHRARSSKPTSS